MANITNAKILSLAQANSSNINANEGPAAFQLITNKGTYYAYQYTLSMPIQGCWVADISIDANGTWGSDPSTSVADFLPNTLCALRNQPGDFIIIGQISRASIWAAENVIKIRICASNQMSTLVDPQNFGNGATIKDVLNTLILQIKQTIPDFAIDPASDQSILSQSLPCWSIIGGKTIGNNIATLMKFYGGPTTLWSITPTGNLLIATPTYPPVDFNYQEQMSTLEYYPNEAKQIIEADRPLILPGQSIDPAVVFDGGNKSSIPTTIAAADATSSAISIGAASVFEIGGCIVNVEHTLIEPPDHSHPTFKSTILYL